MPRFKPRDIVAILVIICATALILSGKDGLVGLSLLGVVAGYYGIDIVPWAQIFPGKQKKEE